jgi:hypothetical protein
MDKNEPGTLLTAAAMAEGFEELMALIEIVNAYNSAAIGGTAGRVRVSSRSWSPRIVYLDIKICQRGCWLIFTYHCDIS